MTNSQNSFVTPEQKIKMQERQLRRIKSKERRAAGHIYCPYCKPQKVEATWCRKGGADRRREVACDSHKESIPLCFFDDFDTDADSQVESILRNIP